MRNFVKSSLVLLFLVPSEGVDAQVVSDSDSDLDLYSEIRILDLENDIEDISLEIASRTTLLTHLFTEKQDLSKQLLNCQCTLTKKNDLEYNLKGITEEIQIVQNEINDFQEKMIEIQDLIDEIY